MLGNQKLPAQAGLLVKYRDELPGEIAQLMSKCL